MLPAVAAWALGLVFASSGLEKLLLGNAREQFAAVLAEYFPMVTVRFLVVVFTAAEISVLPLLWRRPQWGLILLVVLAAAIAAFAALQRLRGGEACGCGSLWAISGPGLLIRNIIFLLLALWTWISAPMPLPLAGLGYGFLALLAALLLGGVLEAVRVRAHAG